MTTAKFPFPASAVTPAESALPADKNPNSISAPLAARKTAISVAVKKVLTGSRTAQKKVVAKTSGKTLARPAGGVSSKTVALPAAKPLQTTPLAQKNAAKPLLSKNQPGSTPDKTAKAEKVEKVEKVDRPGKLAKAKKPKLVRDNFTIPKAEYGVLEELKQRASQLTRPAKKSELLRAGIKALAALSDAAFLDALSQVPAAKTVRPTSDK